MDRSEWAEWIALKSVRGVGNVLGLGLLRALGGPKAVLEAGSQALECAGVPRRVARAVARFDDWRTVDAQLRQLDRVRGRLITWDDESYPDLLRHIHDPPMFLFARGDAADLDPALAIVGSRTPTHYGRRVTRVLSRGLTEAGLTVVSGMARGIDAEAHRSCLRAGGKTIAVLGSGIDVAYPAEHHALMLEIAERGAVLSELPMGTAPDGDNFPARNRIISGMTLGTLVVEAAERSGSLITAQFAADQGREVFAVPGPLGDLSRGPHRLIKSGAALVENENDVLKEIAPHLDRGLRVTVDPPLSAIEARVLDCIAGEAAGVDRVIDETGLSAAAVSEILLGLEIRGFVRQMPGGVYMLDAAGR